MSDRDASHLVSELREDGQYQMKYQIDDVVEVQFSGIVRGQEVKVTEQFTVCGVIKHADPGASYDTVIIWQYLVTKGPSANDKREWVWEKDIVRKVVKS
jgi:hypothetical protein